MVFFAGAFFLGATTGLTTFFFAAGAAFSAVFFTAFFADFLEFFLSSSRALGAAAVWVEVAKRGWRRLHRRGLYS